MTDRDEQPIAPAAEGSRQEGTTEEQKAPEQQQVKYSMSPGFSSFLGSNGIGLGISWYQSGKFYLLGQNTDGGLLVDERFFRKAMGIAVPDKDTILLATLFQIIRFKNVLGPEQQINNLYDACYVPRELFVTGEIDAHDIGLLKDGRIIFSTRSSIVWRRRRRATASRRSGNRRSSRRS